MSWANRAIRKMEAEVTWVSQIHDGYDELPVDGVKALASATRITQKR